MVYNLNHARIGIGMNQVYNAEIILGPYQMVTTSSPGITDTTQRKDSDAAQILRSALLFSYSFDNWLNDNSIITIGFKYNYYYLEDRFRYWGYHKTISSTAPGFSVAARYDQIVNKGYKYSIALNYDNGAKLKKEWVFPVKLINSTTGDTTRNYIVGIVQKKLDCGIDLSFKTIELLLNASYLFWETYNFQTDPLLNRSDKEKVQNQIELNGSLIYTYNDKIKISAGFYQTDYSSTYTERINKSGSALFLTLGSVITLGNVNLDIAFADSHLFSDKFRRQRVFKTGVSYTLK